MKVDIGDGVERELFVSTYNLQRFEKRANVKVLSALFSAGVSGDFTGPLSQIFGETEAITSFLYECTLTDAEKLAIPYSAFCGKVKPHRLLGLMSDCLTALVDSFTSDGPDEEVKPDSSGEGLPSPGPGG